ncbi:hypothetical protein [Kutzneria buriramensis]|uniref:DUF1963 domain-containing protein n=1 Tax=Kutzneria buriramensis TaxID=1045776 RepID=A0A3E0H0D5_9PSEU|nr:hypothetical protein [Kutzneria buriramensis]REH35294.1 hypothetical protein BCF44_118154 [Kutzneria buriramensis]
MTTLLIGAGAADEACTAPRTGGLPLLPADTAWPTCSECDAPQQFIAHLPLTDGPALEVFMCANDPGMCDAWRSGSGANAVLLAADDVVPLNPPDTGVTRLDEVTGLSLVVSDAVYDWPLPENALGQLGGEPAWLQHDETPRCADCGDATEFAAQLEEHGSINFGSGAGYVFVCRPCERGAFLFQC